MPRPMRAHGTPRIPFPQLSHLLMLLTPLLLTSLLRIIGGAVGRCFPLPPPRYAYSTITRTLRALGLALTGR